MDAVRFGSMIRRIRTDCGWTRRRLARRAGLSEQYLGILETGGNVPTLTTILELTEVLGADVGGRAGDPRRAGQDADAEGVRRDPL